MAEHKVASAFVAGLTPEEAYEVAWETAAAGNPEDLADILDQAHLDSTEIGAERLEYVRYAVNDLALFELLNPKLLASLGSDSQRNNRYPGGRSAESFGIFPGDEGYDTFHTDFPPSDYQVTDYCDADFEMGHPVSSGPVVFPETAEQEQARVDAYLREQHARAGLIGAAVYDTAVTQAYAKVAAGDTEAAKQTLEDAGVSGDPLWLDTVDDGK